MKYPEYYFNIFKFLESKFGIIKIEAGLVLGSGLGDFDKEFNTIKSVYTKDIPGYPISTVAGHEGKISLSEANGKKYLIFSGRTHLYEGYSIDKVLLNSAIINNFKIKNFIITNAAGCINQDFKPGDIMLIDDIYFLHFINKFRDLGEAKILKRTINTDLNDIIYSEAIKHNLDIKRGIYGFMLGPSYETPAEIKALKTAGCDAVGMSTIPELLYSKNNNINAIAISAITNYAAGITEEKISHEHVQNIAKKIKDKFTKLLKIVLDRI